MGMKGFDVVNEAKGSMRRRYKLRKNCATI
jgi:hypothetical protein